MALRENVYYWNLSLKNPEPFFDEAYMREEVIIEDTEYLKAVQRLRDLITTYCTMKHEQQSTLLNHPGVEHFTDWIISQIDRVLRNHKNIQYTEFVAFWKCADFSFSVFKDLSEEARIKQLRQILDEYCVRRRVLYEQLGYTPVIHQALRDSAASRSQGSSAIEKITRILAEVIGSEPELANQAIEFQQKQVCVFLPDKAGASNITNLSKHLGFRSSPSKKPDMIVRFGNRVFILEAKHLKESGGSQDKQVEELREFIKRKPPSRSAYQVHFVSFLDGTYFNRFVQKESAKQEMENILKTNPHNFFINTTGLRALVQDAFAELQNILSRNSRSNPDPSL